MLRSKLAAGLVLLASAQGVANAMVAAGLTEIGTIPVDTTRLSVLAENAHIKISHDGTAESVRISSNCPRHWSIIDGTIRQVGFAKPLNGVSMISDALGSRAIVNGKVYSFPRGPIHNVSLTPTGVTVGGKKVEPMPGINLPGDAPADGFDELEVVVPEKFAGDLMLGMNQDSAVAIDRWGGGSFECLMTGATNLTAGKLEDLSKATIDLRGTGKVELASVAAKTLSAKAGDESRIIVDQGNADVTKVSTSGNGTIKMVGHFGDVTKTAQGKPDAIQIDESAPTQKHI